MALMSALRHRAPAGSPRGGEFAPTRRATTQGVRLGAHRAPAKPLSDDDYRLSHQAPHDDRSAPEPYYGTIADGLDERFPGWQQYPDDYHGGDDPETVAQLRAATKPGATVRIYRALPPEFAEINPGDWVTLSRQYAHGHADSEGWTVVAADVPAKHVWADGNSLQEFGYDGGDGQAIVGLAHYREGDSMPPIGGLRPE